MEFSHIPVLLEQAVDALAVKKTAFMLYGTAGGGGHSSEYSVDLLRASSFRLIRIPMQY